MYACILYGCQISIISRRCSKNYCRTLGQIYIAASVSSILCGLLLQGSGSKSLAFTRMPFNAENLESGCFEASKDKNFVGENGRAHYTGTIEKNQHIKTTHLTNIQ